MTIEELTITFDQNVYCPGQPITGHIMMVLDKPTVVNGVELLIKGEARSSFSETVSESEPDGRSTNKSVTYSARESYINRIIELLGTKTELKAGEYKYFFTTFLPLNIPSTFTGSYGGIAYYAVARIIRPLSFNKTTKSYFQIRNYLDLNQFPQSKTPQKEEKSKRFCCLCCASKPLSMVIYLPKTGYAKTEKIPIIVEIENCSNVAINNVKAILHRRIRWTAEGHSERSYDQIKTITLGGVPERSSKTFSDSMSIDGSAFQNIEDCKIITMKYFLRVEADPGGAHCNLNVEIPLTIGDIPFRDEESDLPPSYSSQFPIPNNSSSEVDPVHVPRMKCTIL